MIDAVSGPLDGVRVLEVASHVFVPVAGAILAEWGADVVKIEHPVTGDPYRGLATVGLHRTYAGVDVNVQHANRGKRSVGIDLKTAQGRALLDRFIARSDVFLTNLRPSALDRLGLDVDGVRAANDSIVYVHGSGYGAAGPAADAAAYDIAAHWARSGMSALLQAPGAERPGAPPPAFGDLTGGLAVAGAVATALFRRATTGHAPVIDVSLLGVGLWQIQPVIVDAMISEPGADRPARRDRSETWNPLAETYRTRDGRFITLVMIDADRHWADLCERLGAPELADDPRFVDLDARKRNSRACVELLDRIFAQRDYEDWCRALEGASGAWAPVQFPSEVAADPQVEANGMIAHAELGGGDVLPMVMSPVRFDGHAPAAVRAPEHGEHTEQALVELGMSWDDIAELKESGAIL